MRSPDHRLQPLIDTLSGDPSPEQRAELARWLAEDPRHAELAARLDRARMAVQQAGAHEIETDVAALRQQIEAWATAHPHDGHAHDTASTGLPAQDGRDMRSLQIPAFATGRHRAITTSARPPRPRWHWGAIAAAVVIVAGGILRSTVMHRAQPVSVAGAVLPGRDITTKAGQQAAFLLPDGSRVMLAPGSRLHVPATFDVATSFGRRRDVTLSGRASFTVVHDPARPFLVHTATAMTEDVGTTFQVTAYPEAPGTQVVVVEGSVALWDGTRSGHEDGARGKPLMLLVRGDMATLDTAGTAILTRNVSLDALTAWTRGDLVLDHTPLRDAIPELDRWFNVDIRLADSTVGARRVKAVIHQASAGDALTRLAMVLDLDITRRGRVVVLAPRNPERRE